MKRISVTAGVLSAAISWVSQAAVVADSGLIRVGSSQQQFSATPTTLDGPTADLRREVAGRALSGRYGGFVGRRSA